MGLLNNPVGWITVDPEHFGITPYSLAGERNIQITQKSIHSVTISHCQHASTGSKNEAGKGGGGVFGS